MCPTGLSYFQCRYKLTGGGTLFLSGVNIRIQPSSDFFTNDNYLSGQATIQAKSISNSGTITATGAIALGHAGSANSFSNTGLLSASGGQLTIGADANTTVNNSGGTLQSDNNNGKLLLNADIVGGTLRAASGGSITFSSTSHTALINTLDLSPDSANHFTGTIDLTTSKLILQSANPADKQAKLSQLTAALRSGFNAGAGGAWTGKGLTSSTAAADPTHYAVGLFDNSVLQLQSFGNQPVDSSSLLISIAHLGDANDNGIVDIQDQSLVTNNWQKSASSWSAGDLNLDGFVDIQDLTLVTNNWQQSSAFSQPPDPQSLTPTSIPEPAALSPSLLPLPPPSASPQPGKRRITSSKVPLRPGIELPPSIPLQYSSSDTFGLLKAPSRRASTHPLLTPDKAKALSNTFPETESVLPESTHAYPQTPSARRPPGLCRHLPHRGHLHQRSGLRRWCPRPGSRPQNLRPVRLPPMPPPPAAAPSPPLTATPSSNPKSDPSSSKTATPAIPLPSKRRQRRLPPRFQAQGIRRGGDERPRHRSRKPGAKAC